MEIKTALFTNLTISRQFCKDYQLEIIATDKNGEETNFKHLFEPQIISMANCLAKECNKLFGTDFPFSEDTIAKSAKDYTEYSDSTKTNYRWGLKKAYYGDDNIFEVRSFYNWFGDESGTIYDIRWDKLRIISFVTELLAFLAMNDIHRIAYEGEKANYLFHQSIGIGSRIHKYYQDLAKDDADLSMESLYALKKAKSKELLDSWSEDAMTLWSEGDEYIKVKFDTISKQGLEFFESKDGNYNHYSFPNLKTLKRNSELVALLILNGVDKDSVMAWSQGACDFPSFSLIEIMRMDKFANFVDRR